MTKKEIPKFRQWKSLKRIPRMSLIRATMATAKFYGHHVYKEYSIEEWIDTMAKYSAAMDEPLSANDKLINTLTAISDQMQDNENSNIIP